MNEQKKIILIQLETKSLHDVHEKLNGFLMSFLSKQEEMKRSLENTKSYNFISYRIPNNIYSKFKTIYETSILGQINFIYAVDK